MEIKPLFIGNRSAAFCLDPDACYALVQPVQLRLNGEPAGSTEKAVTSLFHLLPDTDYCLEAICDEQTLSFSFHTQEESCTLDVRRFGAVGDGVHDDSAALQAAILACPEGGRVLVPAGRWRTLPLFLKSHIRLELQKDAVLALETDRSRFPVLPGMTLMHDKSQDLNLGSWEGNPLDSYASLITGIGIEDCILYGEGTLDGQADRGDWWIDAKVRRGAWRGNLFFTNHCRNLTLHGLTFMNSPAWNLHPYFSDDLRFLGLTIQAPAVSPNTDGFDPESCRNVLLAGTHFSVGDDCIAVKSGKIYMGRRYQTPCSDLEVAHCLMEDGHGGVTLGSEMSGGIVNMHVHHCVMRHTDRGLRIKTRRGRGRDGVIDGIRFDHIRMEQVRCPFVVNSLYCCDPDGHSAFVQSEEPQPVDEGTPRLGSFTFEDVTCSGASVAGCFLGLPEKPIESVAMNRVRIACGADAPAMQPAMTDCMPKLTRTGLILRHVARVTLTDTEITGCDGEALLTEDVKEVL